MSAARATVAALAAAASLLAPAFARALDLGRADVAAFVTEVVERDHLERAYVERVVGAAEIKPSIVDIMTRPAEHVRPWYQYEAVFLTERRIREGREFLAAHAAELAAANERYGVPPELVTAIIGVETSYGRIMGSYRVVDALATLAFAYPPRAPYFRGELEQFLLLAREAKFDPLKASGSYAGAMGASQFMPRSYRSFAIDGDGDGSIDLWRSWPDIVASTAHYFAKFGWHPGEPVVAAAELWDPDIEGLPGGKLELAARVGDLHAKGLLFESPLGEEAPAMFVALRAAEAPIYRVGFHNFWVITRYNHSSMYALAVSELAAAIAERAPATEAGATAGGAR